MKTFTCSQCNETKTEGTNGGTGYGIDKHDHIICYQCCADLDKAELLASGKLTGYLTKNDKGQSVFTNWPASLEIRVQSQRSSYHNFAGRNGRTDFWLTFECNNYHGVCIGRSNELATIKKIKS